jgi:hypothetical protein
MKRLEGCPCVIGIVGGDTAMSPDVEARLRMVAADVVRKFRRMMPDTDIEFVAAPRSRSAQIFAEVARDSGLVVAMLPLAGEATPPATSRARILPVNYCRLDEAPDGYGAAAAEAICRYAHALIDIGADGEVAQGLRAHVLTAWRSGEFRYGDDPADDEQLLLLESPPSGPLYTVSLTDLERAPEKGRPFRARKSWRLEPIDRSDGETRDASVLRAFNRLNRLLRTADPRIAADRSHRTFNLAKLAEGGVTEQSAPPAFLRARSLFGQASMRARQAKTLVDVFNYIYASSPAVAVLGYEALRGDGQLSAPAALWFYIAVFAAFLLSSATMRLFRVHTNFLEARVTAELLRAQAYWRLAGVSARLETTIRLWLPGASPTLEFVARSIDYLMAAEAADGEPRPGFALERWMTSQIGWHGDTAEEHYRRVNVLENGQFVVFAVALALAAGLIFSRALISGDWAGVIEGMAISGLPAVAGGFAFLRERFSYQPLADSYTRMKRLSESALKKLAKAGDDAARIEKIGIRYGRETIRESIEWMLTHRLRRITLRGH